MLLHLGNSPDGQHDGRTNPAGGEIPMDKPYSGKGFTLLELLISMSLLVFIVVIASGAMRLGYRSLAAGERKMESQERLRMVLSTMDAQIQSQVPLTYLEEGNKKYYFRGDKKTLRFTTNHSLWNGRTGYVIATYVIDTSPDGKEVLVATEQVPGRGGRRETRFMAASMVTFDYFWKDPAEEQGRWVEAMTDGMAIPEKIRVHLTQGHEQLSLVFPVRVGGIMMTVQGGVSSNAVQGGRNVAPVRQ